MITLFLTISFPYLRTHAVRILLTLLGVVIGVQGMVAMGALNHSIMKSFEAGVEAIAGNARLQIAGQETGIADTLTEDALRVTGVESAVAMVEGALTPPNDPSLRIHAFGVDLLGMIGSRSPQFPREHVHIKDELQFVNALDSIALGQPLLNRLGLEVGDSLRLATPRGVRSYVIRGRLDDVGPSKLFGGMIALLDLPAAENIFLADGLAQTIYVTVTPEVSTDTVATDLRAAIGKRARVERTEARGRQMDALLGSIRVALSLASLVTMIAAFFIIYETIAISVEQRRREIAIARSLGFTRGAVAGVFMLESFILGLVGAMGGVAGGYLLARASLATSAAGVSGMYFTVAPGSVSLPIGSTIVAVSIGTTVCLLAGVIPALVAAGESPTQVIRGELGTRVEGNNWVTLAFGVTAIVCSLVLFSFDPRFATPNAKTMWIMAGHTLLIVGTALLAASYIRVWARILVRLADRAPLIPGLACEFFSRRPARIAASASAIMVGYALVVVLGSVVVSIEGTLRNWLEATFGAEISIGTSPGLNSALFDSSLTEPLRSIPGVKSVERYRKAVFIFEGNPVIAVAFDRRNRPDGNSLVVVDSEASAYEEAFQGRGVFVSESFAHRYGRKLRDVLTLETASGAREFRIVGIARDYTMDLGTILIAYDVYERLWKDHKLTYAHIWTEPGADLESIRAQANHALKDNPAVSVVTNLEFRADVEARVRDLLKVLGSLQVFACAVAVLGVINFLLASILDRKREISLLRSMGITTGQIRSATMIEGGLIGFAGASLGLLAGFPAAYFMVTRSMQVAMGWSLDFRFPLILATMTIVTITITAALAAYFPARRITRGTILAGLQME